MNIVCILRDMLPHISTISADRFQQLTLIAGMLWRLIPGITGISSAIKLIYNPLVRSVFVL